MARTRLPHIFIIEGIPGSGKDTLTTTLLELLHKDARPVYHYPEEALGFSYTHWYWPGITMARLSLMESALDFVEEESRRHPGAVFVFNRFHLSLCISLNESSPDAGVQERFSRIIDRLRLLNVLVLRLQLEKWKIASVLHPERVRRDIAWKLFLTRRMRESPYNTPQELYTMQQQQLIWLVQEQGLPYRSGTLAELLGFVASF